MSKPSDAWPRRTWLMRVLLGAMAATVAAILCPVARFLRPHATTTSGATEVVAPYRVSDLRPDADGQWPSPFNFGGKPCLIIRTESGEIKAFSALCTHMDCTVKFRPDKGDIFCGCHGGIYDTNGQNVSGPPPRPLQVFKVVVRGKPGQEEIVVSRA